MTRFLCPYCGGNMLLRYIHETEREWPTRYYECSKCYSHSPLQIGGELEDAAAKAKERFKPMQKPFTFEEALDQSAVWIEWLNNIYNIEPCIINEYGQKDSVVIDYANDYQDYAKKDSYGELWRCWASKPTDEECKAAKWKEIVNETD